MAKWSPWKKSSRLLPQWPAGGPGAVVNNLTTNFVNKLTTNFFQKSVDKFSKL